MSDSEKTQDANAPQQPPPARPRNELLNSIELHANVAAGVRARGASIDHLRTMMQGAADQSPDAAGKTITAEDALKNYAILVRAFLARHRRTASPENAGALKDTAQVLDQLKAERKQLARITTGDDYPRNRASLLEYNKDKRQFYPYDEYMRGLVGEKIAELKGKDTVYLIGGHDRHHALHRIKKYPDGSYSFTTYNAGEGAQLTSSGKHAYGIVEQKLAARSTPVEIAELVRLVYERKIREGGKAPVKYINQEIDVLLGKVINRDRTETQYSTHCGSYSTELLLQDRLDKTLFDKLRAFIMSKETDSKAIAEEANTSYLVRVEELIENDYRKRLAPAGSALPRHYVKITRVDNPTPPVDTVRIEFTEPVEPVQLTFLFGPFHRPTSSRGVEIPVFLLESFLNYLPKDLNLPKFLIEPSLACSAEALRSIAQEATESLTIRFNASREQIMPFVQTICNHARAGGRIVDSTPCVIRFADQHNYKRFQDALNTPVPPMKDGGFSKETGRDGYTIRMG